MVLNTVPLGSEIENSAAIYFDFNEPVITNTTIHRIEEDFITVSIIQIETSEVEVLIAPNPFRDQATFEIKGELRKGLQLLVYNQLGQLIRIENFENNVLNFHKKQLIPGLYFYKVNQNGQKLNAGKIMIK